VQLAMQTCSTVYNCTTQLTDIQRFQYTRNVVPQSGIVDMQQLTSSAVPRSPLLEMHSWDGIAKGVALSVAMQQCSYVARGGFVNSMYWLHCKPYNLHKTAQSSGAQHKCIYHRIAMYSRVQRSSVTRTFRFEEVVMPVYHLPCGLYGRCH
jgi:hypothetical protein